MIAVIDLTTEFAKLTMLEGRSPTTTDAEKSGAIARLAPYRDGAIFASKFAGTSDWERHPQGDEIVQIVEGATTLRIITEAGLQSLALGAGMVAVVPQGMWHRFQSAEGASLLTATPQPTEHLSVGVEDPRMVG
jgi:mannose-6-phosphate isomerase-like protein (cupin superfamily)